MTTDMHESLFDKPGWLAIVSVLWIEVIEVIPFLNNTKLLLQSVIAILTIIYLILKIKHIKKINQQIDKENGKETNTTNSDI